MSSPMTALPEISIRRVIEETGDGLAVLTLSDQTRVNVSRRRVPDVRRALEG